MIAPVKTGNDSNNKRAVIPTDQPNIGIRSNVIPDDRILIIVVMKFTAIKIVEIPEEKKL